jgi:hypothetical protein
VSWRFLPDAGLPDLAFFGVALLLPFVLFYEPVLRDEHCGDWEVVLPLLLVWP